MQVLRSELLALARKYRELGELRRGVRDPDNLSLRALAREFPGALRELECLPLDRLDGRLEAVLLAATGVAEPQEWMAWMIGYHRHMRVALAIKRRLGELGANRAIDPIPVARYVHLELREPCDAAFVLRVARPPSGRLNRLVFEILELEHGRDRGELEQSLFPELAPAESVIGPIARQ